MGEIIVGRGGFEFGFEAEAVAGVIQDASSVGEFGFLTSADARRSRWFVTADETFDLIMTGKAFALPTLDDPASPIVFDLAMSGESFLIASDFGGGTGGGSGVEPPKDGFGLLLGDIAQGDGSWLPGAVPLADDVAVSEAIDRLNEIMGLLVPTGPAPFPNGVLSIANTAGSSPRLAAGDVPAHIADSGYVAGGEVTRVVADVDSFVFNDVGPGNAGTVTLTLNGVVIGSKALTGAGDAGNYNGLLIADQKDYPEDSPGFYKTIDVSASGVAAPVGVNALRMNHSETAQTNRIVFVRDDLTATPALSAPSVIEGDAGVVVYSSGVPHYGDGASLTVSASMNNLAGETYYGGTDVLTITSTGGVVASQSFGYGALGVATPIARQSLAVVALTPVSVSVNGSGHSAGQLRGQVRNVNGASAAVALSSDTILIKRGAAGAKIDETSIPVTGLGSVPNAANALRKGSGAGDTPAGAPVAWSQQAAPATHEATVVGGVLKHDQTNYASGYLPAGPNLSAGRAGAQYVTLSFRRAARSAFKIAVTGAYAGCWIKLPGVTDQASISPNAPNGWMNGFKPYDGAGVPGEAGDPDAGCAVGSVMTGTSGTFQITFGTQTSTNATDNEILVRFRLNPGQSITALSFTA